MDALNRKLRREDLTKPSTTTHSTQSAERGPVNHLEKNKKTNKRNRKPSVPRLVDLLEHVGGLVLAVLDRHPRVDSGRQQPGIPERKLEVPLVNLFRCDLKHRSE